jgi:hypothetical protein
MKYLAYAWVIIICGVPITYGLIVNYREILLTIPFFIFVCMTYWSLKVVLNTQD